MTDFYFVVTGKQTAEIEVIRRIKPNRIMVSFHYFKCRKLTDFFAEIGYTPKVMLDSGAYSAYSLGKDVALTAYLRYLDANLPYIRSYIALDVIGSPTMSLRYYDIMREEGYLDALPVYHFGAGPEWLVAYQERGAKYVALGNTVPIDNKQIVVDWVNRVIDENPDTDFHLLGSSHKTVVAGCPRLKSRDSSSWSLMAANGYPKAIPGRTRADKMRRMEANMRTELVQK